MKYPRILALWYAFKATNDRLIYDTAQEEDKWRPWTSDLGAALVRKRLMEPKEKEATG